MPDSNNSDEKKNNRNDRYCMMCRRSESKAGKLIPMGETNLADTTDAAEGLIRFMTKVIEEGKAVRG